MAAVVSGGQLRSLNPGTAMSASNSYSTLLSSSRSMSYAAIYRQQPAVRTVVSFLARNLAQLGLHTYKRMADNDRRRLTDHPVAQLLSRPNSRTTMYRLIFALVADRAIYDDAYWLKVAADDDGPPIALRRIPPWRMEARGPDWTDAEGYRLHGTSGYVDLSPEQVVHFRGYNPDDGRIGCSPIEALRQVLAEEYAATQWRSQMWSNGARVSGYLKRPSSAPEWSKQAKDRFRDSWQAQYTGDGPQAGGTPILEDDMDFIPATINPRDAQYIESRKLTREEVAAEYHVAPPLVGILDHATFSNIREQHKQLYQDTLGPWCADIEQELGLQLIPYLPQPRRVYVEFNIAEKLQGSFDEQAQQLQMAVGGPYMTRNEARGLSNLPRIEGGDELIVPLNVSTGDGGGDDETEQPALPAGDEEEAQDAG